jgi:tetratricopeptide (TPR) repeat protein
MTIRLVTSLCLSLLAVSTLCYSQAADKPVTTPAVSGTSRLEVVRLLRARDFDRLDRAIRSLQEAVERDIRQELALGNAISAFDSADPAMTALIQEWVKVKPDSYAAHLAYAAHAETLAWEARGSDWSDRTSAEQVDGMKYHLGRMVLEAETALRLNPRLTVAMAQLISAAKATSDEDCARLFQRFYKQVGASFGVRISLAVCLLPRWRGSYEALEALAEEASEYADDNPRLRVLGGMVAWDRGTTVAGNDPTKAAQFYTDALQHGPYSMFLLARSRAHFDRRRHNDALADIEQALTLVPHSTEALMLRAWNLINLGRTTEAAADVRLVTELDPLDDMLADFRKDEVNKAVATARRRNSEGNPEAAILRLNDGIALVGDHPEMLFWRGRARLEFKDKAGALADLQRAVQLDPRHFDAILGVDFILVERGQYLTAVQYWNDYLTLEPTNSKALLARAKAHIGRGDVQPGLKDAKAACDAGVQEGCLLASEVR